MTVENSTKLAELNRLLPDGDDFVSEGHLHFHNFKGVVIDDALSLADGGIIQGNVTQNGDLVVNGDATLSDATVSGKITVDGELEIKEKIAFGTTSPSNWDGIWYNDSINSFFFLADDPDPDITPPVEGDANVYGAEFYERGTRLTDKYLRIDGKAEDSDLLDGKNSTAFLQTLSGGTSITVSGTMPSRTVSHSNVSGPGTVNNSGGTVLQDITVNAQGHVTSVGSTDLDARYLELGDGLHPRGWANINNAGTINQSRGRITGVTREAEGQYRVSYSTTVWQSLIVTPHNTGTDDRRAQVKSSAQTSSVILISNEDGALRDCDFTVVLWGSS